MTESNATQPREKKHHPWRNRAIAGGELLRAEMDGQRLRDAVANVVSATGIAKNRVYRIALAVANNSTGTED